VTRVLIELPFLANRTKQTFFPGLQPILQFELIFFHAIDRHRIDIPILHRPHDRNLLFNWNRVVLLLLEQLDNPLTAFEARFGPRVQIGTELRERRQPAELRQIELHFAGHLLDRLDLRSRTDAAYRQADRNCRTDALVKRSVSSKSGHR